MASAPAETGMVKVRVLSGKHHWKDKDGSLHVAKPGETCTVTRTTFRASKNKFILASAKMPQEESVALEATKMELKASEGTNKDLAKKLENAESTLEAAGSELDTAEERIAELEAQIAGKKPEDQKDSPKGDKDSKDRKDPSIKV